jgi:hypothetical protein
MPQTKRPQRSRRLLRASVFQRHSLKTGRKLIRPREEIVFHHCGEMLCGEGFGVNGAVACSVAWTILP